MDDELNILPLSSRMRSLTSSSINEVSLFIEKTIYTSPVPSNFLEVHEIFLWKLIKPH